MRSPSRLFISCFIALATISFLPGNVSGQNPNEPSIVRSPNFRVQSQAPPVFVQKASATIDDTKGTLLHQDRKSIELKGPTTSDSLRVERPKTSWSNAFSMVASLVIVLSLFSLLIVVLKRSQPKQFQRLPSEVVQVMGRSPMGPRQQLYVIRFGAKIVLVSHQPGQTATLSEISDPQEAERLLGLCEASQTTSITHSFRDVLRQVSTSIQTPTAGRSSNARAAVNKSA